MSDERKCATPPPLDPGWSCQPWRRYLLRQLALGSLFGVIAAILLIALGLAAAPSTAGPIDWVKLAVTFFPTLTALTPLAKAHLSKDAQSQLRAIRVRLLKVARELPSVAAQARALEAQVTELLRAAALEKQVLTFLAFFAPIVVAVSAANTEMGASVRAVFFALSWVAAFAALMLVVRNPTAEGHIAELSDELEAAEQ